MPKTRRLLILLFIVLVAAGCDRATKSMAQRSLAGQQPQEFAGGLFRLEYAENAGSFLSLGASLSAEARFWIFTVFVALLLAAFVVFILRMSERTSLLVVVAMALVVSGGLSNLVDRLLNEGRVVDFMQLSAGPLRTGIFNVADLAIMGGLALMLLALWREEKAGKASANASS